jgi:hypothetical protein
LRNFYPTSWAAKAYGHSAPTVQQQSYEPFLFSSTPPNEYDTAMDLDFDDEGDDMDD